MPNTTATAAARAVTVRVSPDDDDPAPYTLAFPDGTTEEALTFPRAADRIAEHTDFALSRVRDLLRKARLTGNAHIGGVILEPCEGGGVLVLCRQRHVIDYVAPGDWAGSTREARFTNPGYLHTCHGAL